MLMIFHLRHGGVPSIFVYQRASPIVGSASSNFSQIPSLSWQSGQADQGLPRQRPAAVPQLNALAVQFFLGELTNGNGVFLQVEDFNSKTELRLTFGGKWFPWQKT